VIRQIAADPERRRTPGRVAQGGPRSAGASGTSSSRRQPEGLPSGEG